MPSIKSLYYRIKYNIEKAFSKLRHAFKGCYDFKYKINKNGKPYIQQCKCCGQRSTRVNGQWVNI